MKRVKWIVLGIVILNLPLAAGALSPEKATMSIEIGPRLTLSGDTAPEVEILRGAPGWAEGTRLTFSEARWDFFPDGTFLFTPGAAAKVRDDLYPIAGTYRAIGDRLEFYATRRADLGASLSLAGFLVGLPREPRIVVVKGTVSGVSLEIVRITQALRDHAEKRRSEIWPPVPATFSITLQGKMEEEPFGPLTGALALSRPREGDPNPISLSLETSDQTQHGSLAWSSFLADADPLLEQFNSVTLHPTEKEVVAQVLPGAKNLLAPNWVRLVQPPGELSELGAMPDWVQAEEGKVRLHIDGSRLSGEIEARGQGQQPGKIRYEAKIEGELQDAEALPQPPSPTNPYAGEILFGGAWHSRQHGEFNLRQTGATVAGTFAAEGGTKLAGQADGNVLPFRWSDEQGGEGTGLFVALSDRSSLVGLLLEEATGRWRIEMAERRVPGPGSTSQVSASASREDLKDRGYDLVLEGRCLEAIEPLERARALCRQDRDRIKVRDLMRDSVLIDEVGLLTRLSACYTRLGRFEDLLASLRETIYVHRLLASKEYLRKGVAPDLLADPLETYRRQLAGDLEKIQVQDASRSFFEELVGLLIELDQETEALVASEKARARAFADLLAAHEPLRSLPGGQVLRAGATLPVTAEGLKDAVRRSRSTVVEYMLTGERLFAWVISPEGAVRVETVPVARQDLENLVRNLLPFLGATYRGDRSRSPQLLDASGAPEEPQSRILRQLHRHLITPIAGHLPPQGEPVTFVPEGLLFLVPFPALLDTEDQPLLTRFTPTTMPAISVLASLRSPSVARWAASEVLVVGDPSLPPHYAHLGQLPGAQAEAETVAGVWGALPLIGSIATIDRVTAAMPGARLIHFASHGLLEHGEEKDVPGALVFAPTDRSSGLLTAREIAGLRLRADLVVLSACDSGSGRITGDGVVGLARSFLAAGANGVVVSLWQVDDEATAVLMAEFYNQIKQGGDRAQALRQAMIETRKSYPDPRLWAAFTFIGMEPEVQ